MSIIMSMLSLRMIHFRYEMIVGLPPFYNENVNVMYERILRAKLSFPSHVSPAAVSFLSGLIERDVKKRLGSSGTDAEDLKSHPFFDGLDWEKVFNKEIEPVFRPKGAVRHCDCDLGSRLGFESIFLDAYALTLSLSFTRFSFSSSCLL